MIYHGLNGDRCGFGGLTPNCGRCVGVQIAAKLLAGEKFTVDPNEGSVLFSKLCRQIMIQDLTFHDSRATALTHLAKKVDVMTLARISRHKDINLLHRVYYRETSDSIAARL